MGYLKDKECLLSKMKFMKDSLKMDFIMVKEDCIKS